MNLILPGILVLLIINIVPILVYGALSKAWEMKPPQGASPKQFLLSIFVSKIGTAIAFTTIFYLARDIFADQWLLYSFIWWLTFLFGEIGQAVGPGYTKKEAIAGIISETIYLPLSAYILQLLIK